MLWAIRGQFTLGSNIYQYILVYMMFSFSNKTRRVDTVKGRVSDHAVEVIQYMLEIQ